MVSSGKKPTPGMLREEMAISRFGSNVGSTNDVLVLILRAFMRKNPSKAADFAASLGAFGALLI